MSEPVIMTVVCINCDKEADKKKGPVSDDRVEDTAYIYIPSPHFNGSVKDSKKILPTQSREKICPPDLLIPEEYCQRGQKEAWQISKHQ